MAVQDFDPSSQADVLVFNQDELNVVCVRPNANAGKWLFLDFSAQSIQRTGEIDLSTVGSGHSFSFYLERDSSWEFISFTIEVKNVPDASTAAAASAAAKPVALVVPRPSLPNQPGALVYWAMSFVNNGGGTITGDAWFSASGNRLTLTVHNPNKHTEVLCVRLTARPVNTQGEEDVTSEDPQITVKPQTSGGTG